MGRDACISPGALHTRDPATVASCQGDGDMARYSWRSIPPWRSPQASVYVVRTYLSLLFYKTSNESTRPIMWYRVRSIHDSVPRYDGQWLRRTRAGRTTPVSDLERAVDQICHQGHLGCQPWGPTAALSASYRQASRNTMTNIPCLTTIPRSVALRSHHPSPCWFSSFSWILH